MECLVRPFEFEQKWYMNDQSKSTLVSFPSSTPAMLLGRMCRQWRLWLVRKLLPQMIFFTWSSCRSLRRTSLLRVSVSSTSLSVLAPYKVLLLLGAETLPCPTFQPVVAFCRSLWESHRLRDLGHRVAAFADLPQGDVEEDSSGNPGWILSSRFHCKALTTASSLNPLLCEMLFVFLFHVLVFTCRPYNENQG